VADTITTAESRSHGLGFRGRQLSEAAFGFLLASPLLIVTLGIIGYPLAYALTASFQRFRLTAPDNISFVGFDNYYYVLIDPQFWVALRNTLLYAGIAVPLELALGLVIAMALNKLLRGARLVRTILILPMMLAPVVMGLMWKFMFNDQLGIINHLIRLTGLDLHILWLADPNLAFISLLIVEVWATTPIMVILLSAGLTTIPAELYEAAEIDGASRWQRFVNITWPMLQPVILVSLLLRGMDAFRVFDIVFVLTQGGPANSTDVLSYYAYRTIFQGMDVGGASAVSMMMLVVLAALGIVLIRRMRGGIQ
jgi:multiple sugar transport system permease protein